MKFEVALDADGRPSWWLYGAHAEPVAWAGRYYASLDFAHREAMFFRLAAPAAAFEVFPHPDGGWSWRAVRLVNYYMGYSSCGFPSMSHARRAVREIQRTVPRATGL